MGLSGQFVIIFASMLLPLHTARAQKANTPKVGSTISVVLTKESKEGKDCQSLADAVSFHLKSTLRFVLEDNRPTHTLIVRCTDDIAIEWVTRLPIVRKGKAGKIQRSVVTVRQNDDDAFQRLDFSAKALVVLKLVFDELPWTGEVSEWSSIEDEYGTMRSPEDLNVSLFFGDANTRADLQHIIAKSPSGLISNALLTSCVGVQIGLLKWNSDELRAEFQPIGYGLVNQSTNHATYIEAYVKKNEMPSASGTALYFRFADTNLKSRRGKLLNKTCREKTKQLVQSPLNRFAANPANPQSSTDYIELNSIDERLGFAAYQSTTENGVKSEAAPLIYFHNTIGIGDYLGVDLRAYRHILTRPYSPSIDGDVKPAECTIAEGHFMFRISLSEVDLDLGAGLAADKVNVPYRLDPELRTVENVTNRKTVSRAAGMARIGIGGESLSSALRSSYSFADAGPFATVNLNIDLRLSKTWYVGTDMMYASYSKTNANEPNATVYSFGFHLGFALERVRN